MAHLVEVFRIDDHPPLQRRQSLLVIEDELMIVMDLSGLDLVCENLPLKNKEIDDFLRKYNFLSEWELKNAFQITFKDIVNILGESIPCVGCRRRVERLYYQLMRIGGTALDPLLVKSDGTLIIKEEVIAFPKILCSIFMDHSERLSNLIDAQPRLKKSRRCILHSWDHYKSRPVTPAWKDVWALMHEKCKKEVLLIGFSTLISKLENYLKKHRFCAECRTKIMKAYSLLIEDCDPTKEKGFMPSLYQKIKRCFSGKHIHLPNETKYIDNLIARAEPELMGNRRERHAKTMEIAQEEVLICIGLCFYDRLRRIYVRLQEEEFTCRVLAAVAVEALCRSFEMTVEKKRGISQLELFCEEINKEELAKRIRKETKKLKKKRKKEKRNELDVAKREDCELQLLDQKIKERLKCSCEDCRKKNRSKILSPVKTSQALPYNAKSKRNKSKVHEEDIIKGYSSAGTKRNVVAESNNETNCSKANGNVNCEPCFPARMSQSSEKNEFETEHRIRIHRSDHYQDHGYSSEHNNESCGTLSATSSLTCSPEGSEIACSEGFCDHEGECNAESNFIALSKRRHNTKGQSGEFSFLLEEMLEQGSSAIDEGECFISPEEIQAFKAKMPLVDEKRSQLRQILKNRFAQLCKKSQAPTT